MTPAQSIPGRLVSGERQLGRTESFQNAARVAAGFRKLGIVAEDTVALMLRNDFPYFEAALATSNIGAQAVPINWHFQADEAGYILRDCGPKALLLHADLLPQIASTIPETVQVFVVDTPPEIQAAYGISAEDAVAPAHFTRWSDWVSKQEPVEGFAAPTPPISMIYTSGTTGHPKGIRRGPQTTESAALTREVVALIYGFAEGKEIRTVVTGPLYHGAPNFYGLCAVLGGGICILQPRFDAEGLLRLIEQHRITHLHMVPTMFVRLLRLPEDTRTKYDLSSLEFVVHAAAPCPVEVKRKMIDWWGPVINEYYGGTEIGIVVFHTSREALCKPGTVGRALPGRTVRVYDGDGNPLGPNQTGEIYARVHGYTDFTYHGLDEQRRAIERDGLVTVGDIGYLDEDGYLFLRDRKNYMVISGGVNIYPAEIEAALMSMHGVNDCAVFGIPDEEFGESLCAYIEPQPGVQIDACAVRDFLTDRLAHYKIPKVIEFRGELPREDSGKIFKRKLRAPYWEKTGRLI
jgi:long-chain acyl-CoA synthetase